MSFRINTNTAAMGALHNLNMSSDGLNKSINRLSTGLRINSAADDPAGLIISETFRTQISSLEQAVKNNQDAINYTKTAEGALNEVNTLLRDARSLAVASANSGVLTAEQLRANQDQLSSIAASVTRIAQQTQFGTKRLLDGSSGVRADVSDATKVTSIFTSGTFAGKSLNAGSDLNVLVTRAAARATYTTATDLTAGTAVAGSFSLNGTTFSFAAGTSPEEIAATVNAASGSTGVTASIDTTAGKKIKFDSTKYGANAHIDYVDAQGLLSAAGTAPGTQVGIDAQATVTLGPVGTPTATQIFTGGSQGNDGLTLTDADGNKIRLAEGGNVVAAATKVGQVSVGSAQFQIGGNQGQTALLSLGNFAATELGNSAVSGLSLANVDITSTQGANDAMAVLDQAIEQVSAARGRIGNFQRNILESNVRSLGVAKENLSATESAIRDTDVAAEMSTYTKMQILQQAGLSVLGQANSAPQAVLSLLKG